MEDLFSYIVSEKESFFERVRGFIKGADKTNFDQIRDDYKESLKDKKSEYIFEILKQVLNAVFQVKNERCTVFCLLWMFNVGLDEELMKFKNIHHFDKFIEEIEKGEVTHLMVKICLLFYEEKG